MKRKRGDGGDCPREEIGDELPTLKFLGDDQTAVGGVDVAQRRWEREADPGGADGQEGDGAGAAIEDAVDEEKKDEVVEVAGTAEGVGGEEGGGTDGVEEGTGEGLADE